MKIRPLSNSTSPISVSPVALRVLACALLLVPACSSDEAATEAELPSAGPSRSSGDPDVVAAPGDAVVPELDSSGAETFSAPPPEQEPPATETNFLVPPCRKTGPTSDVAPVGDAGVGTPDAATPDAGMTGGEQPDAAASSEPFDQSRCAEPSAG